jgi:hypothetical protein
MYECYRTGDILLISDNDNILRGLMIDTSLILEILVFVIIFIISSIVPIYLHMKFRFRIWICSLISLGLTLLTMNGLALLFMNLDFNFLPISKSKTGEFYEIFWLIPPAFVGVVTFYLSKRKKT